MLRRDARIILTRRQYKFPALRSLDAACCGYCAAGGNWIYYGGCKDQYGGHLPLRFAEMPVNISELETHRRALFKFAMLQLRDEAHAEDAVQQKQLAAIRGAGSFAGDSSVRTWLVGILKHKITDHFRKASREQPLSFGGEEMSLEDFDVLFKDDGHYIDEPRAWSNPEDALSQSRFFEVLERCLEMLPKNTARVFTMREIMGVETDDIC